MLSMFDRNEVYVVVGDAATKRGTQSVIKVDWSAQNGSKYMQFMDALNVSKEEWVAQSGSKDMKVIAGELRGNKNRR